MIVTRGLARCVRQGSLTRTDVKIYSAFARTRMAHARVYASETGQDDTMGNLEAMTGSTQTETPVDTSAGASSTLTSSTSSGAPSGLNQQQRDVNKFASTFAPRASGSTGKPNPAYKGSWLYTVFDVQAWAALVIGGLLSFNIIFPSDQPDIARLMGMWSIWMFTIPSLRARECTQKEKDALNILFLLVPLANVLLPFVWKNFGFIFSADVVLLFGSLMSTPICPVYDSLPRASLSHCHAFLLFHSAGVFQWKGYWEPDEETNQ